jgi:DNA-binding response OmpR family regulator
MMDPSNNNIKVVIVDDDPDDRTLFCDALKQVVPDVQCFSFGGAQEAIDHLRTEQPLPDFVFLDIQMDNVDGKECLLRIKRIKSIERVSVVIYSSALESEREKQIYRKLGANHVMEKPSTFQDLCNALSAMFKKS